MLLNLPKFKTPLSTDERDGFWWEGAAGGGGSRTALTVCASRLHRHRIETAPQGRYPRDQRL
jgi:hypothetical protein